MALTQENNARFEWPIPAEAATLGGPWQAVVYDPSFLLRQPGTNRYYVPVKEASRFYRLFKP